MAMQSRIARLVAQMAAIAAAGSTQGQGTGFLFDRAERPLTIPLAMNVGLLGFVDPESDTAAQRPAGHSFVKGGIDSTQLESALATGLPFHVPYAAETGESLGVEYSMSYTVKHLPESYLVAYETALKSVLSVELQRHDTAQGEQGPTLRSRGERLKPMLDVEATEVQSVFDGIFQREFAADGTYSDAPGPSDDEESYAVLIVHPRLSNILPTGLQSFNYRYRYRGSHCAISWVGARRYVVLDVGAGPCPVRSAHMDADDSENEVIGEVALPPIRRAVATPRGNGGGPATHTAAEASSALATVVISALRQVFLPDAAYPEGALVFASDQHILDFPASA